DAQLGRRVHEPRLEGRGIEVAGAFGQKAAHQLGETDLVGGIQRSAAAEAGRAEASRRKTASTGVQRLRGDEALVIGTGESPSITSGVAAAAGRSPSARVAAPHEPLR